MVKTENSSTKNQRQTENFDSLSKFWWDENDKSYKVLREINRIRVEYLKEKVLEHFHSRISFNNSKANNLDDKIGEQINDKIKNLSIIDVGCGGGILSSSLAKFFNKVTAIDASYLSIEEAKIHAAKHGINNIDYIVSTPEEYASKTFLEKSSDSKNNSVDEGKEEKFDIVVSFEVLEHVDNLDLFIKSCTDLVKDDGLILFSTINKNIKSYLVLLSRLISTKTSVV